MSQKFIYSAEKTAKKGFHFQEDKGKKFSRKRSQRQKSTDSRRSKEDSSCSRYIKNPLANSFIKLADINQNAISFVEQFDNSFLLELQTESTRRKGLYNRTNTGRQKMRTDNAASIRMEMLETQIKIKEGESQRFKVQFQQQREKRRRAQNDKRNILKEFQQLQKVNEKLQTDNKKLLKQKEYLLKQIQFLERINYDQKTRNIQSYRQRQLLLELQKYKQQIEKSKSQVQAQLFREIEQIRWEKNVFQEQYRSSSYHKNVLLFKLNCIERDFQQLREVNRQKILGSAEYIELKERYRRFIETYKQVRAQNWTLRNLIDRTQVQLSLTDDD